MVCTTTRYTSQIYLNGKRQWAFLRYFSLLTKTFRNLPVNVLSQCGGGRVEEVEGVFPEEIDGGEIVPSV